jgi:hypothetical protein
VGLLTAHYALANNRRGKSIISTAAVYKRSLSEQSTGQRPRLPRLAVGLATLNAHAGERPRASKIGPQVRLADVAPSSEQHEVTTPN